jgi:E3 ubiquitin-protein ligase MARCH6
MRILTDPVVDSVMFLILRFLLPGCWKLFLMTAIGLLNFGLYLITHAFGQSAADRIVEYFAWVVRGPFSFASFASEQKIAQYTRFMTLEQLWGKTPMWSSQPKSAAVSKETSSVLIRRILTPAAALAEPYFVSLGKEVRIGTATLEATWERLALGQGATERTFAIALGYVVVGLILSAYLNVLTVGNVKSAGKALRGAVRQQLLIIKVCIEPPFLNLVFNNHVQVAAFIFIELAMFPLGCGIVLDFCTVWLFPEANVLSRSLFFFQAPLTAMFYHWVAGTMFMYLLYVLRNVRYRLTLFF